MALEKKYPEPVAGAIIINKHSEVFLMTSPKWHGKYILPGGHIEVGETYAEALKREVKEETGLDVFGIELLCVFDGISPKDFHKKKHFIFLDCICRTKAERSQVMLNEEGKEFVWAKVGDALKLPLESFTRKALKIFKNKE